MDLDADWLEVGIQFQIVIGVWTAIGIKRIAVGIKIGMVMIGSKIWIGIFIWFGRGFKFESGI